MLLRLGSFLHQAGRGSCSPGHRPQDAGSCQAVRQVDLQGGGRPAEVSAQEPGKTPLPQAFGACTPPCNSSTLHKS